MMCILSVYAPQTGRKQEHKDASRSNLEDLIGHVEPETVLVVAGDMNDMCERDRTVRRP